MSTINTASKSNGDSRGSSAKRRKKEFGIIREVEGEEDASNSQFNETGDEITPFNLTEENEQGHFDGAGNYVWKREEKSVQEDAWLENVSEKVMDAAGIAKAAREEEEKDGEDQLNEHSAKAIIFKILEPQESVARALRRLGSKPKKRQRKGKAMEETKDSEHDKDLFNQLTEAADYLLRKGHVDVYQETRNSILPDASKQGKESYFNRANSGGEEPKQSPSSVKWEYKGVDGSIYGPHSTEEIIAWRSQGYFTGETKVQIRQVKEPTHATSQEKKCEKKSELSAEQELMNDLDDSEEDEEHKSNDDGGPDSEWKDSDSVPFESYL